MTSRPQSEPAIPVLANGGDMTETCWSCGEMRAAHFCSACGKLQPAAPTDYFSFFGLPRRMNLDPAVLEREMYALNRRLHPDLYVRSSLQEQEWSLELTSQLNDAYRTLRDPIRRTEYLLRLEGIKLDEQSKLATEEARAAGSAKKQLVPPDLLEEVFEVNLQLDEMRASRKVGEDDPALAVALKQSKQRFERKLDEIGERLRACWNAWDSLIERAAAGEAVSADERRRVCRQMLDVLNQRKYITAVVQDIGAVLE
jgi:molecular chaperone HscB